jgi:hypothetical protein
MERTPDSPLTLKNSSEEYCERALVVVIAVAADLPTSTTKETLLTTSEFLPQIAPCSSAWRLQRLAQWSNFFCFP